jgi:putative ABC transport system permease protein
VVARTVLRESIVNTLVGIGIGLVLALLAGRAVQGILVGVSGRDLPTLSIVAATLLAVSVAAAVAPAWRAARIDPIVALRAD